MTAPYSASNDASAPFGTSAPPEIPTETPPVPDPTPGTIAAFQQWIDAARIVLGRFTTIAVMEARLATVNLIIILVIAVASGLLLASAWIALFAAIVAWLHTLGLTWHTALLLIAAINFAVAAGGAYAIYRLSNNLLLRTLRAFLLAPEKANDEHAQNQTPPAQ
jgi:hypothetical protein